jgi:hypothetical protein
VEILENNQFDALEKLCYVAGGHMSARSRKPKLRPSRNVGHLSRKPKKNNGLLVKQSISKTHDTIDPATQQQLKIYEEALVLFQAQKFPRARPLLIRVKDGPSLQLADRARVHLSICDQRIERDTVQGAKSSEEHYTHGVALMNLGRWDEARDHLERARKTAPQADYIVYAMAALDCLCGESETAMKNLALAIRMRAENRYLARNDTDFAFLEEDPRFTELLYPERETLSS